MILSLLLACSPGLDAVGDKPRADTAGDSADSAADSAESGDSGDSGDTEHTGGDSAETGDSGVDSGDFAETGDSADTGTSDPCGDPGVIPRFGVPTAPALSPVPADADHGSDNIYAPDVVRVSAERCLMFYGGQGRDGHDQIFLATSTDCANWVHWPDRDAPAPVIAAGGANHVNDPSVVLVGGTWYLYYTVAQTAEDDRIHLATSTDGFSWAPQGLVLDVGAGGTWDDFKVGRPAVVYRDGLFWLYYDGNDGTSRHVGVATSADGRSFTRHAANPLVLNAGAVDVDRVADTWIMLREAGDGTYASTSADGLSWCDQGRIFGLTGGDWDRYGQVTPFLHTVDHTRVDALLFGGASDACWCHNRVGQALPDGEAWPADPDQGCGGCVADSDCTQACRDGGYGVDGVCAHPGSTDPGVCCACF